MAKSWSGFSWMMVSKHPQTHTYRNKQEVFLRFNEKIFRAQETLEMLWSMMDLIVTQIKLFNLIDRFFVACY